MITKFLLWNQQFLQTHLELHSCTPHLLSFSSPEHQKCLMPRRVVCKCHLCSQIPTQNKQFAPVTVTTVLLVMTSPLLSALTGPELKVGSSTTHIENYFVHSVEYPSWWSPDLAHSTSSTMYLTAAIRKLGKTNGNRAYQQLLHHSVTLQTRSGHKKRRRQEAKLGGPMPWCLIIRFLYNVVPLVLSYSGPYSPNYMPPLWDLWHSLLLPSALLASPPAPQPTPVARPSPLHHCNPTSKLFFTPSSSSYRLSHHVKIPISSCVNIPSFGLMMCVER